MGKDGSRAVKPLGQDAFIDAQSILNALSHAVVVVDNQDQIVEANMAAEQFFRCSTAVLRSQPLNDHIAPDSPLFSLLSQVRAHRAGLTETEVNLDGPRIGSRLVSLDIATIPEAEDHIVLTICERGMVSKIDRQMTHRNAARSVTAMAAMLAHEVKNPLSGIRGAAQLLEQNAIPDDQPLTRLIVDESDRICALVDRMEIFADRQPLQHAPVNIHRVLEHVRRIAQNGFARNVRFVERYDPSLPLVFGHRDQLIQIFLNLIKNAAEAAPSEGGEITLTSAYRHGAKLTVSGCDQRIYLPLIVSVQDNGAGIPQDLWPYLFDPFVTTKANGSGLGLPLVAKIVHEHGGIIEFDSERRRTVFRVHLPMYRATPRSAAEE